MRKRIMLIFFLLTLIPLLLLGTISYNKFSNTLEKNAIQSTEQIIKQMSTNLEWLISDLSKLSLAPLYDKGLLTILKRHQSFDQQNYRYSADSEKMSLFLSSLKFDRHEIKGIHIIANDGHIYSHLDRYELKPYLDLHLEDWFSEVVEANGAWVLLPAHSPSYYQGISNEQFFSVARLLREPNTNEPLGLIKIDINQKYIEQILPTHYESMTLVLDKLGRLVYSQMQGQVNPMSVQNIIDRENLNSNQWMKLEDHNYLGIKIQSQHSGLTIYSFIPQSEVLQDSLILRNFTIVIIVISALIALFLAIVSSSHIVKPIRELTYRMEMVHQGKFNQHIEMIRSDEIGQMVHVFNDMVEELDYLMKEVYQKGLREREAELKALQSQMNPHFMYNTLESINLLALQNEQYDISDMISQLGRLHRYSLTQGKTLVPIRHEVQMGKAFLHIMQFRLQERLHVHWDVDETLLDNYCPRFILQPLLENAIQHGIHPLEGGGTIWVRIRSKQNSIVCSIDDNGVGIPPEQLKQLKRSFKMHELPTTVDREEKGSQNGLALWNIHRRLILLYGSSYGLNISSQEGYGTSITLQIPLIGEEEDASNYAG